MEGSWTEVIRPEQGFVYRTLVQLSCEEIVAIWDAVSNYILEEMSQDKAVLIVGLGTFGTFREVLPMDTGDKRLVVRRPVFQMDRDADWLRGLQYRKVTLPVNLEIKRLDMGRLSRATSYSWQVVEGCVEETIRLFSSHVRKQENVAFTFGDIGVLARQGDRVHMQFSAQCARRLEAIEILISGLRRKLLLTELPLFSRPAAQRSQPGTGHMFPRFQLAVRGSPEAQAFPAVFPKINMLKEERGGIRSSKEQRPGKHLQDREELSLPVLPKEEGVRRQQSSKSEGAPWIFVEQWFANPGVCLEPGASLKYSPHPPSGPRRAAAQHAAQPARWRPTRDPTAAIVEEKRRELEGPYEERQAALAEEAKRQAKISLQKQFGPEQRRRRDTQMPERTTQMYVQESRPAKQELLSSYRVLRDRWKKKVEVNRWWLKKIEERRAARLMDRLQGREQKDRVLGSHHHHGFLRRK